MTANAGYTELTEICEIDVEFSVILAKTFYIIASTYRNHVIDIFELEMEGEKCYFDLLPNMNFVWKSTIGQIVWIDF